MSGQSKWGSFKESVTDTVIGLVQGTLLNLCVLPLFDFHPSLHDSFGMAAIFTGFSLLRRYVVRRWFNNRIDSR